MKLYPEKKIKKHTGHEIKGKVKSEKGAVWCQPTTSDNQVKQENCEEVERQSPLYHYHHSSLKSGYLHIFHVDKHMPNIMQDKKYQS